MRYINYFTYLLTTAVALDQQLTQKVVGIFQI